VQENCKNCMLISASAPRPHWGTEKLPGLTSIPPHEPPIPPTPTSLWNPGYGYARVYCETMAVACQRKGRTGPPGTCQVGCLVRRHVKCWTTGWPKKLAQFVMYTLTSSNSDQFANLFSLLGSPEVCRYTTLWNVSVLQATARRLL